MIKRNNSKLIIMGIDPGIARCGYGLIAKQSQNIEHIDHGLIETKAGLKLHDRLYFLHKELDILINKYNPDLVGVEDLYFCKNVKTALIVGQARGVVLLTVMQKGAKVFDYTPLQVKQAVTSYGHADKRQVQEMVKIILNLPCIPQYYDAADALAVAICCSNSVSLNEVLVK